MESKTILVKFAHFVEHVARCLPQLITSCILKLESDYAPDQQVVDVGAPTTAEDFELEPGMILLVTFIDKQGAAIPDVEVQIVSWRGSKALYNHKHPNVLDSKIPAAADKNGVYRWTWAPTDEVEFTVYKRGKVEPTTIRLTAEDNAENLIELMAK